MTTCSPARGLISAVFACALLSSAAVAAEPVPCDRRVPRDAVAYVSVRNVGEFRTQWGLTLLGKLAQDENLGDLRDQVARHIEEFSQELQQRAGMGLAELLSIPHGELAAAVTLGADGKPAVAVLMDYGDREEPVKKLLEKLEAELDEQGMQKAEDEFEDTRLVLFKSAAGEDDQPAREVGGYFLRDSFIVAGSSADALKAVISRWDGTDENVLAENPVYRYIGEQCRDDREEAAPVLTWFVDPVGFVKVAIASQPEMALQGGLIQGMLPATGLDGLKGLGGSFDMARGEFDMVSRAMVYVEPPARGVLNMFQFDVTDPAPPAWVGAGSASYMMLNWNIEKAFREAETLVDTFRGRGSLSRTLDELSQGEDLGGVHLKKDVIDVLTGRIHIVGQLSDQEDDVDERYLIAAETKNAAAARATLRKLAQIPLLELKERTFQGELLYEIEPAGAFVGDAFETEDTEENEAGGETDTPAMGIAVAENHLMFATDVSLLEEVLRGTGGRDALSESAPFRRVAGRFPERAASASYQRQDTDLKSLLAFLKSPQAMFLLGDEAQSIAEALPSYEVLKKYMPASGSFMIPDDRGLKIVSFSLRNEAE